MDSEHQLSPEEKKGKLSPNLIKRTFMRTSPKVDNTPKIKSPNMYFNKQLFSPRSKNKAKSSSNLNVRRFSSDGAFNSQTMKPDRSTVIGRRLSKDASAFLSSSPPDINSRRSSYLDIISTGSKLAGKSPVLSIENVSDASSRSNEPIRKLSDSESIGRKLATLPKYSSQSFDKQRLQPQYSLNLGKSDDALNKSDKLCEEVVTAKSCQNLPEASNANPNLMVPPEEQKSNLSDDEIARRNKQTIDQLQNQLVKKSKFKNRSESSNGKFNTSSSGNPSIRIQIEDTSKPPTTREKKHKTRHQSIGKYHT